MAPRKPAVAAPRPAPEPGARRSARLQEAAAGGPVNDPKTRITKPAPKPKPKPQKYDCTTCGRTLAASSFPDHLATDNCEHLINTCKGCMKTYIAVALDNTTYDKLSCPECKEVMGNADVKRLAARDVYEKYDEFERRGIAEKIPGWRWCLRPKCRAGQVHQPLLSNSEGDTGVDGGEEEGGREGGKKAGTKNKTISENQDQKGADVQTTTLRSSSSQKESTAFSPDISTCETCAAKACIPCDRPYHEGETCTQYTKRQDKEEKATLKLIASKCKQCPKCGKNIEKNGGCDAVYCRQCGEHFCWLCLTPYHVVNASGHGKGCTYAQAGRFDPHALPQAPGNAGMFN